MIHAMRRPAGERREKLSAISSLRDSPGRNRRDRAASVEKNPVTYWCRRTCRCSLLVQRNRNEARLGQHLSLLHSPNWLASGQLPAWAAPTLYPEEIRKSLAKPLE